MRSEGACKKPRGKVVAEKNLLIPGAALCPVQGAVATLCCPILTYIVRNFFVSWLYKCNSQRTIGNGDLEVKLKTFHLSFRQIDLE